VLKTVVLRKSP